MKRVFIIGSLVLAFIIAGCSDKSDVQPDQNATSSETTSDANNTNNDTSNGNSTMSGDTTDTNIDSANTNRGNNNLKSIYFKFDKFSIDGENISIVKSNAQDINNNRYREVRVEGNTDEWGNDEYNFALALKRASAARDALISNGVAAESIKLVSYGESKPVCLDKTKECWQENRRVDFVLID